MDHAADDGILGYCRRCGRAMGSRLKFQKLGLVEHFGKGRCRACAKTEARGARKADKVYDRGDTSWMNQAACVRLGVPADWFFPNPGEPEVAEAAKHVCAGCPVKAQCHADRSAVNDRHSIRAGLTATKARVKAGVTA